MGIVETHPIRVPAHLSCDTRLLPSGPTLLSFLLLSTTTPRLQSYTRRYVSVLSSGPSRRCHISRLYIHASVHTSPSPPPCLTTRRATTTGSICLRARSSAQRHRCLDQPVQAAPVQR